MDSVNEDDLQIDYGDTPPLVPDGMYHAAFTKHEAQYYGRSPKMYLHFRIVDPGDHQGKELYRAYSLKGLVPKSNGRAKPKVSKNALLFEMLCRVLDVKSRPDRLPISSLKGKVLLIRTR